MSRQHGRLEADAMKADSLLLTKGLLTHIFPQIVRIFFWKRVDSNVWFLSWGGVSHLRQNPNFCQVFFFDGSPYFFCGNFNQFLFLFECCLFIPPTGKLLWGGAIQTSAFYNSFVCRTCSMASCSARACLIHKLSVLRLGYIKHCLCCVVFIQFYEGRCMYTDRNTYPPICESIYPHFSCVWLI